jgi:hypothetical protein
VRTSRRRRRTVQHRLVALALALLAALIVIAPGSAGAGTAIKRGTYSGKTDQDAVATGFRRIQFTVSKGKVTLTTEPIVARGLCLSTDVFTQEGTSSKKLGRNRTFTLTHTFFGSKIDKIHGRFVSSNEVEGYAIYHFFAQDLCLEGKTKVNFKAKHK